MSTIQKKLDKKTPRLGIKSVATLMVMGIVSLSTTGCSLFHPVRGVPASYLPDQFEGPRRGGKRTINPSLLTRAPQDQHRIAAGDVLSVYIPGILGPIDPEGRLPGLQPPINQPSKQEDPPTIGYPITVRDDQTISLPQIPPIYVYQKTISEVETAIRRAYTEDFQILRPEEAMILVSLQRPRVHRVLVVRQETGNELASSGGGAGTLNIGVAKKGTARVVTLDAYENDVLHALATEEGVDGLPGLDAENTIYIIRRSQGGSGQAPYGPPSQIQPIPPQPPMMPGRFGAQTLSPQSGIQLASYEDSKANPGMMTAGYESVSTESSIQTVGHSFVSVQVPPQPSPPAMQNGGNYPGIGVPMQGQQFSSPSPAMGHQFGPAGGPNPLSHYSTPIQGHAPLVTSPPMVPGAYDPQMMNPQWSTMLHGFDPTIDNPNVIRIPIRLAPGESPNISEEMVTLYDGDIVFIESRETDVFYTGGLLGGGQYTLPREYDLGVLEAISIAEGRNAGGGGQSRSIGGVSALNRDVSVSASRVIILRTLPTGQRITVEVDLHKAMRYQHENILVQPGDMLLLQYTAGEAVAAFTQRYLLEGALFSLAAAQFQTGQ